MDDITLIFIRLILAWGFVLLIVACSVRCHQITKLLKNSELVRFVLKTGGCLLIYALLRFVASVFDAYLAWDLPAFSYFINYLFWLFVLYTINRFYKWLECGFFLGARREEARQKEDEPADLIEYSSHVSLGFERQDRVSRIFRELIEELKFSESPNKT